MKKNISTFEELELEQERLKMLMEITRQEFARNLGSNRKELKKYLLKNVVVPAGAVGLGVAAVNKMTTNKEEKTKISNSSNNNFWNMLLPLGVNLFQTYFLQKQTERIEEISDNQKETPHAKSNLRAIAK